jgi:hypothetical protein
MALHACFGSVLLENWSVPWGVCYQHLYSQHSAYWKPLTNPDQLGAPSLSLAWLAFKPIIGWLLTANSTGPRGCLVAFRTTLLKLNFRIWLMSPLPLPLTPFLSTLWHCQDHTSPFECIWLIVDWEIVLIIGCLRQFERHRNLLSIWPRGNFVNLNQLGAPSLFLQWHCWDDSRSLKGIWLIVVSDFGVFMGWFAASWSTLTSTLAFCQQAKFD